MASSGMKNVVPWFNRNEWEMVYKELYSNNTTSQQHAIMRVAAWRSRSGHKLSRAIECTTDLVRACLEERISEHQEDQHKLCMSYSMAIIRFINILTDSGQNKQYAQPLHLLAQDLGLPEWLVDLRHEASHSSLPSLPVLREGCHTALEWLKEEYWEAVRIGGGPEATNNDLDTEQYIQDLLVAYQQETFKLISNETAVDKKDKSIVRAILSDVEKLSPSSKDTLVHVLMQPGYVISTEDQILALGVSTEELASFHLDLPKKFINFWAPLLVTLHHLRLTGSFVMVLADGLSDEESLHNKIIVGWISAILSANSKDRDAETMLNFKKSCQLPWKRILEKCVMKPSECTHSLAKRILQKEAEILNPQQQQALDHLMNSYLGHATTAQSEESPLVTVKSLGLCTAEKISVEEIKEDKKMDVSKSTISTKLVEAWQLANDTINWADVPLGSVLGLADISTTAMELPALVNNMGFNTSSTFENYKQNGSSSHLHEIVQESGAEHNGEWNCTTIQQVVDMVQVY